MAVLQACFRRDVASLSGPLGQTGTLAHVVHDVARTPILAILRTDVVLAVLAIEQRWTLAPLLAIFDDALAEVAGQFTLHGCFLGALNHRSSLVDDFVVVRAKATPPERILDRE